MALQRLLVGPDRTALRRGVPAVVLAGVLTAASTAVVLTSNSGGGVYFPLDAVAVGVGGAALYAARYRALAVCLAVGVAAFAGSYVGFHAVAGDEAVLGVLARFARDAEGAALGALAGGVGGAAGSAVGRALAVRRQRT
ncbi:hypothetical protein [Halobacterium yunchengense]|uniref:hypothetical protein n=1 Tax=Halobacterium yunchengense TaxID=3108497 RepID=UPI00300B66BD